ncbi:MAG: HNH endonuclease [bacterium]|nr:HNH endonuclease [bacterium]
MSRESVVLNPGVAFCFRRFHGLVTRLVQDAWIRFVRNRPANQPLLGEAVDLGAFLFGSERANLDLYRPLLVEMQGNTCFYCTARLGRSDVDHFIPWSKYPHDLGHNFVLACAPCNHSKRDLLADHRHRERWLRRNQDKGAQMSAEFQDLRLPHDLTGSLTVAACSLFPGRCRRGPLVECRIIPMAEPRR